MAIIIAIIHNSNSYNNNYIGALWAWPPAAAASAYIYIYIYICIIIIILYIIIIIIIYIYICMYVCMYVYIYIYIYNIRAWPCVPSSQTAGPGASDAQAAVRGTSLEGRRTRSATSAGWRSPAPRRLHGSPRSPGPRRRRRAGQHQRQRQRSRQSRELAAFPRRRRRAGQHQRLPGSRALAAAP